MTEKPNIVLVTVDSLRSDHAYGDVVDTPTLDSVRDDGVTFETAVAQGPFTTFSMPSLFTSRYPSQLTHFELPRWGTGATVGDVPTLQERLQDAGYRTLGVHSNPLLSEAFGFERGFDKFYDSLGDEQLLGSRRMQVLFDKVKRMLRSEPYVPADVLTDVAIDWLQSVDSEPFFLWVHYMDVHGPYKERDRPPVLRKFLSEWRWQKAVRSPDTINERNHRRLKTTYESEVAYTDDQFGRLIEYLQSNDYYDDSLLVYTADHGEEFREHGAYSHGHKLYEELVRVPLVVSPPDDPVCERVETSVPLLDVTPTLVDAAGGSTEGFDGDSLVDVYRDGETDSRASRLVSEAEFEPTFVASVRTDDWKYTTGADGEQLYDLREDPEETRDVLEQEPEKAAELRERLSDHVDATDAADWEFDLDDDELHDRLERLGYL